MRVWRDPKAQRILTANFLLVLGASLTFMAVPWLIIQRENGNEILGYSNTVITFLVLLLMPYFGKLVDRTSRKRVVLGYLLFGLTLNCTVAGLTVITGKVELWHLLTVFSLGSLGATVYYPAQFALNQEIFASEQYESLSGAVEIQWQAGAMIAGAIGAFLVGRVPLWIILLLDSTTYLTSFLLLVGLPYQQKLKPAGGNAWRLMFEGFSYLRERPRLTFVLLASFLPFMALMVSNFLSPIFVHDVLRRGADVYAIGEITYAVGAITAGLVIPDVNHRFGLVRTLLLTIGIFMVATALNPLAPVAIVFWFSFTLQGLGNAGARVARSILVLKTVPNEIIGRVNLFYSGAERLLRSLTLFAATSLLTSSSALAVYWLLAAIAGVAWLMVWTCRGFREYPIPPTKPVVTAV
jgi:MFS family permease